MNTILNKTKTEWIIINDKNEIWVGQKHPYFMPLSEFGEARVSLKSYRGWKSAINGILQAGGCTEDGIRNNKIRVLPVSTVLQVDESYTEVPVSSYFVTMDIERYILTEDYKLILDLEDIKYKDKIHKCRFGSNYCYYIEWKEKDKYGVVQSYYDKVVKSSNSKEELEKLRDQDKNKDLIDKLIKKYYAEDVGWIDDEELERILQIISNKTGKKYLLTLHDNVESWGSHYDISLWESEENIVDHEEWLCYTR